MPNLIDVAIEKTGQSILLYGPPFCGKTQLAASLANHFDTIYWFDLEKGFITLKKLSPQLQQKITYFNIPDTYNDPVAVDTMTRVLQRMPVRLCDTHGKVNCVTCKTTSLPFTSVDLSSITEFSLVVIDSLTQLSASCDSKGASNLKIEDKREYDNHRIQGAYLRRILELIQVAPFNIVCTSHEINIAKEDKSEQLVPSIGTRNFSRMASRYFDHVIHMKVTNKKHKAYSSTTSENKTLTGSRTDVAIENDPEMELIKVLRGEKTTAINQTGGTKEKKVKAPNAKLAKLQSMKK